MVPAAHCPWPSRSRYPSRRRPRTEPELWCGPYHGRVASTAYPCGYRYKLPISARRLPGRPPPPRRRAATDHAEAPSARDRLPPALRLPRHLAVMPLSPGHSRSPQQGARAFPGRPGSCRTRPALRPLFSPLHPAPAAAPSSRASHTSRSRLSSLKPLDRRLCRHRRQRRRQRDVGRTTTHTPTPPQPLTIRFPHRTGFHVQFSAPSAHGNLQNPINAHG